MNRAWISGRIDEMPRAVTPERVLIIRTFEPNPQRILTRYRGDNPLSVGDLVESYGTLVEETVVAGGQVLTTPDGREAKRNVYHAAVIFRLVQADASPSAGAAAATPPAPAGSTPTAASADPRPRAEVRHVRGPELPWQ